ncbi:Cation efflux system protein CusB [bioreactor metagenome]|uniref:Cation efflux system protein CusB n=1 Tax=bioreactor metagenome TaxID=1076179 RepID=A0A645AN42_9ZZZZ
MHPQIRMHEPGKCPICGMDLIPLSQNNDSYDSSALHLTKEAAALANIVTTVVSKQDAVKEIRLFGKVQADERLRQSQVAFVSGRIEGLYVNFTGDYIQKGRPLASVYSPGLVIAQQELLESAKSKQSQPAIYEAVKDKLRQLKLTDAQINAIEKSGVVQQNIDILATTSGVVTALNVKNGDYITPGTVLCEVANLSNLWVMFDAYESDLPFISVGDKVSYTLDAVPGKSFTGRIAFVDPVIDPITRVAKARVEISNIDGRLKPEMFATGIIQADLSEYRNQIIIPASAVLWTGKRSIVYIRQPGTDEPVFKLRKIELGPRLSNSFVVLSGLKEGEVIVTQGAFAVDAAAQLDGKPSMMNPGADTNNLDNHNTMHGM